MPDWELYYETREGLRFQVAPGSKSHFDFRIRYLKPERGRRLTPRHVHVVADLLIKRANEAKLGQQLIGYLSRNVVDAVDAADRFPPTLQVFSRRRAGRYRKLDEVGLYSVEALMVLVELLSIQERTNYPTGTLMQDFFYNLLAGADLDSVIGAAAYVGRR